MNAKEEIQKLQDQLDILKAELDKPELEVGTYIYVIRAETGARGADGMLGKIIPKTDNITNGIDGRDSIKIQTITGSTWGIGENHEVRKPESTEIETALRKEAERRGFKKGVKYEGVSNGFDVCSIKGQLKYYEGEDCLTDGYGNSVYHNGKWAEIVQDKVTFFDWDVEYGVSLIGIGCEDYSKNFLLELESALNHLSDKTVEEVLTELEKLDLD